MAIDDIYTRAARRGCEEDLNEYVRFRLVEEDAAKGIYRCQGCGREEGVCSVDPCEGVIRDRGEVSK